MQSDYIINSKIFKYSSAKSEKMLFLYLFKLKKSNRIYALTNLSKLPIVT